MTIHIQRGLRGRIVELADSLVLMVNTPSNPAAARASLERLAVELGDWGAKFVSEVVQCPIGALVLTDAGPLTVHLLRELPERIVAHLRESGVESGEISIPNQCGPLNRLNVPRAVFLRLMPPLIVGRYPFGGSHQIPPSWLSEAVDWIDGYEGNGTNVGYLWAEAGVAQFPLEPSGIAALLADGYQSHTGKYCVIVSDQLVPERFSDDDAADEFVRGIGSIRGIKACFGPLYPYVELAIGGIAPSDQDLCDAIEFLKMVARRLASTVGYGYVSIEPSIEELTGLAHGTPLTYEGGPTPDDLSPFCDTVVFDAFPYQILGPGHLKRLGSIPLGARPLEAGRVELEIGTSQSWLNPAPAGQAHSFADRWVPSDPSVQAGARELLEPCLVRKGDLRSLRREMYEQGYGPPYEA